MKQLKINYLFLLLAFVTVLVSCRKDKPEPTPSEKPTAERKGLFILSEGLYGQSNSSLTYYDYGALKLTPDQFFAANIRGLGDTGNDIKVYGSKMYIVVNVSNTVEVVNSNTAKSIKQIELKDGATGRQPRYIAFNKNKAFISCYDGTVAVMDTASLNIEKYIKVGRNPERMAIANGKLYVANSGGLDFPNYDNTVSVIDLSTLAVIKTITVVENPGGVAADQYGDVYVLSAGNYSDVKRSMTIINSQTDVIKSQAESDISSMVINGDQAYVKSGSTVKVYNVKTETIEKEDFISDGTQIKIIYGIAVDDLTGEVFITDAIDYSTAPNGEVFCFNKDGKKKYAITAGINPNNVVFVNK
jgi:YVTN family beta-propeller protein